MLCANELLRKIRIPIKIGNKRFIESFAQTLYIFLLLLFVSFLFLLLFLEIVIYIIIYITNNGLYHQATSHQTAHRVLSVPRSGILYWAQRLTFLTLIGRYVLSYILCCVCLFKPEFSVLSYCVNHGIPCMYINFCIQLYLYIRCSLSKLCVRYSVCNSGYSIVALIYIENCIRFNIHKTDCLGWVYTAAPPG